jgi:hypothetical protein
MFAPGFSAEASLYRSGGHYATVVSLHTTSPGLMPARTFGPPPPPCPTFGPCDSNCMQIITECNGSKTPASCCGPGFSCVSGQCVCPAPKVVCDVCTNLQTDPNNCGACGNSCNGGTCSDGKCNCSSAPGLTLCGNTCVNLQTDSNNCGSCGKQCLPGVGCFGGLCNCPGSQYFLLNSQGCEAGVPWRDIYATLLDLPPVQILSTLATALLAPP